MWCFPRTSGTSPVTKPGTTRIHNRGPKQRTFSCIYDILNSFADTQCAHWKRHVLSVYTTGAQEWHIVSLLSDVTSPTTVAHYVRTTCDLRVLSTEKHFPVRRQHTVYTNKSLLCKGKHIVRHWTSREASLRHKSGWGTWSVSPQYRDLRTRGLHQ